MLTLEIGLSIGKLINAIQDFMTQTGKLTQKFLLLELINFFFFAVLFCFPAMAFIQGALPNLATADPSALAVAKFLRHNKQLKAREGIMDERRYCFFKGK